MIKGLAKFEEFIDNVEYNIDLNNDVREIGAQIIKQIPDTFPNQFYYVVNNSTRECIYVSDSVEELTGYTPEEWTYTLLIDVIHPDDKPFVDKALYACYKLNMTSTKYLPIKDAMIINYRIKHKDGHYIHILRNGYCSSMDLNNRMVHNTSMCMVVNDLKRDNAQTMVMKQGNKIIVELHSDNSEGINWKLLSKREHEVVELLCNNKTSEEIAQQLFISKHTVDTHRRKILKKLNVKNSTELLFRYLNKQLKTL